MNIQKIIFISLIVIAGFIFYQTKNDDASRDSVADDKKLEITNEQIEATNEEPSQLSKKVSEGKEKIVDEMIEVKDQPEQGDELADPPAGDEEPVGPIVENIEGQTFTPYTNKAINYTIDRPNNWYWQHLFVTELTPEERSDDILVIDRNPLSENNIYTSMIIIDRVESNGTVPKGNKTPLTLAGGNAERYEDGQNITYSIDLDNNKTLRLIYISDEADENEKAIFEHIVASLTLN